MNSPYSFSEINMYNSVFAPSTVHVKNTGLARFFKRYLLQEAMSVFKFTLPANWEKNYVLYVLYTMGYISVIKTDKFGIIPQHCTLGGYTVQYQPFYTIVTNPLLDGVQNLRIGVNTELIKLQPDYCGLYDIVDYYGDLLALCAETAAGNVLNSKLSYVFAAENKAQAESLKKLYDNVASGEPAQFVDKNMRDDGGALPVALLQTNVGQNFIADRVLDAMRMIRNAFLTDIGIDNVNISKQSGVSASEVSANDNETRAKVSIWYDSITESMEKVRAMFGISETDLRVEWRVKRKSEGGAESGNADDSDTV